MTTAEADAPVKRGRGRPPKTAAAIERRRQEIIEAAYEIFAEKGYHASGIADIAERLDIGHGTFYRYFKNKRDILDHVVDYGVGRFFAAVMVEGLAVPATAAEFRAQMTEIGNRLFAQIVDEDPRLPRMILLEATAIDAELLERVLGLVESAGTMIAPMLSFGVNRGFVRADLDVQSAAKALVGTMIAGLFSLVRGPMSLLDRTRYVDTVVSMICDNTPPASPPADGERPVQRAKKSASS
jgi:AcrR family transcriptional regulator